MASGGNMTPGSRQDLAQFPPEVLRAAVEEAHRLGLPVTAHAHAVGGIADAVAAGVDGLEHVSFWTEDGVDAPAELIRLIASRRITVGATVGMVPMPGRTPPPEIAARLPRIVANTRRLYQAGAPVVAGTDAGMAPVKPHDVVRYAPAMLRPLGYDQAGALRAITAVAASVCGLGHRKGRIAPGFDADILAVDGDPIADPDALHRIRAVFALGTAVQPGLPRSVPAVVPSVLSLVARSSRICCPYLASLVSPTPLTGPARPAWSAARPRSAAASSRGRSRTAACPAPSRPPCATPAAARTPAPPLASARPQPARAPPAGTSRHPAPLQPPNPAPRLDPAPPQRPAAAHPAGT